MEEERIFESTIIDHVGQMLEQEIGVALELYREGVQGLWTDLELDLRQQRHHLGEILSPRCDWVQLIRRLIACG